MKPLILFAMLLPMAAQPAPQEAAAKDTAKDGATKDAAPAAQTSDKKDAAPDAKESPVPSGESWLTGSIDLGYRWNTGVGGSSDAYRSIINLGSGPKLIGSEFTITDPQHRAFDQIHVRAYSWGDEPYSTFHLDARKSKLYDFRADYRDFAYFNFLPSYADPLLARGIVLNEQSFDTRRRFAAFSLDLLPGGRFVPYFAFDRDSNSGRGATTFVTDGNEYPVPNTLRDSTNLYRGGVRIEFRRFHATLEEGGTTFKDDQSVFQGSGINFGNNTGLLSGHTLDLTQLLASYGIRGDSTYSKGLFTASATSWLDLYGQFLYSEPRTDVHYQQTDAGSLFLQSQFLFYGSQQYLLSSTATLPHTTASAGAEIRPMRRLRVIESWLTDRLHNTGGAGSNQILTGPSGTSQQIAALLASSLITNYSQNEIDVYFDAASKLTLRGGYRYVWGDASQVTLPSAGLSSAVQGTLRRNVGLGGLTYRPGHKISLTAEAEAASGGGTYFRTSLYNYQKVRAQARYQATNSLSVSADFSTLENQNPLAGTSYTFSSFQESASVMWMPAGKNFDFQGSYSRYDLKSDIGYLAPQDLSTQVDHYRERAHTVTAFFDVNAPKGWRFAPKLTAGGSFLISSGSRPTSYFQPVGRLSVPLGKHVAWFSEWRYYGYGEAFFLYEGFRSHLVTTGLRFMR